MTQNTVHAWFRSTTGRSIMSHNGSPSGCGQPGTLTALRNAYNDGYRWMQIDALPIKGDLVSRHSLFGSLRGFMAKDRAAVKKLWDHVPSLRELLNDEVLLGAHWNIEMKSKKGLAALLALLGELQHEGRDLSAIMISSPMRPSVLQSVGQQYPDVALAAPVIHGGVFGRRFLGAKRATVANGRPYDCQQVLAWFVRKPRPANDARPLRQAWTISRAKTLDRVVASDAHPIVDSKKLVVRRERPESVAPIPYKARVTEEKVANVEALALGGGGWRGAFGGIGAVMYFAHTKKWASIRDVVGISGGSFAVAQLSRKPATVGGPVAGNAADPDDPSVPLKELLGSLQVAGRRAANILLVGAVVLVAIIALVVVAILRSWQDRSMWAVLFAVVVVLSTSFLLRLVVSLRWTAIVKTVFGRAQMSASPRTEPGAASPRRYAIGATGLNDGHLYSFTSHQADDGPGWLENRNLATPLGDRYVSTAVIRATSLPGLGQLGATKLWLPTCAHDDPKHRSDTCEWVPDRLVDGGISGIFGRGLVRARPPKSADDHGPPPTVVVVDAGRSLEVNNDRTVKDRASGMGERLTAMLLMVRWLKVALFVAYRDELGRVRDDQVTDGYSYRLVRLAEEEDNPGVDDEGFSQRRHDDLNRLYVLRDQLHRFSLTKANRSSSNRAVTVAVAACALEFGHTPDIVAMLEAIGERLGRGHELADAWRDVRVPLLGQIGKPDEFGPEQVGGTQPIDQGPRQPEVAGQSN